MSNLAKRTISAIILAPLFLYLIQLGGYFSAGLALILFVLGFYEWVNITKKSPVKIIWFIGGFIYLSFAFFNFALLSLYRPYEEMLGLYYPPVFLYITLILVWVTDISAYFVGRTVGGAKLAPKISPNKTWSGAIGGVVGCVIVLLATLNLDEASTLKITDDNKALFYTIAFHILLPIISQIGDLFESYIKRRFGVKDSSNIIPGHGGILDRFDGLILVLFVYGIFSQIVLFVTQ